MVQKVVLLPKPFNVSVGAITASSRNERDLRSNATYVNDNEKAPKQIVEGPSTTDSKRQLSLNSKMNLFMKYYILN